MKLTDTHRIVLSAAGARERALLLPLPKTLKLTETKAKPLIAGLIKAGLVAEIAALEGDAIWRADEASGKLTLIVTAAGLKAVGIALNSGDADQPVSNAKVKAVAAKAKRAPSRQKSPTSPNRDSPKVPKPESKLGVLISALKTKKGSTLAELTQATGWQPHSVRGAISGALKKKLGLAIDSSVVDGRGRVYRITE